MNHYQKYSYAAPLPSLNTKMLAAKKLYSRTQGQTQAGLGKSSVPSYCYKQDRKPDFEAFFQIVLQELKTKSNPHEAGKLLKPTDM